MNKDDIKPILDKLHIKPNDKWITIHKWQNIHKCAKGTFACYYYTFKRKGITYCVSGDSISYVFSDEEQNYLYQGYDKKELIKKIKEVLKNGNSSSNSSNL